LGKGIGMKQTAVEWLADNLHYLHSTKWDDILEQAKEMEKEQMKALQEYLAKAERDNLEAIAFIEGMLAAFELVDKKMKEKKK
jgi:adenosylmethionine-8-amino-7-oxononanoate aminotransferase